MSNSGIRSLDLDVIGSYLLSLFTGSAIAIEYILLPLKMSTVPAPYYSVGILLFLFLLLFVTGRVPSTLILTSEYRNFLGPVAGVLISFSLYIMFIATTFQYMLYSSVLLGLGACFGAGSVNAKLSEDYDSFKIRKRKTMALAFGTLSFPAILLLSAISNMSYENLFYYSYFVIFVVSIILLLIHIILYALKDVRPKKDNIRSIFYKTIEPIKMLAGVHGEESFLILLSIDILFVFSAWAVLIYLPFFAYRLLNSQAMLLETFALVSLVYIVFRYLGTKIRSSKFNVFSYFFRPAVFIFAFFMLSLVTEFAETLYAFLIFASVGLFEHGAKTYMEAEFPEGERSIIEKASRTLRTPFIVLAPLFSYQFFSISFSLGFASAIIPAAVSLLLVTFTIGNIRSERPSYVAK